MYTDVILGFIHAEYTGTNLRNFASLHTTSKENRKNFPLTTRRRIRTGPRQHRGDTE